MKPETQTFDFQKLAADINADLPKTADIPFEMLSSFVCGAWEHWHEDKWSVVSGAKQEYSWEEFVDRSVAAFSARQKMTAATVNSLRYSLLHKVSFYGKTVREAIVESRDLLEREMTRLEHDFGFCRTHEERADNESRWAALREELGL